MTVQAYAAFEASRRLQDLNETFISNMRNQLPEPQAPLLNELLEQFIEECLDYYFVRPVDMVKLNNVGRKIVNGGVSAIKKTAKMAIAKIVKKLSNEDLIQIANYIDSMLIRPPEGSDEPCYVAVPISDELHQQLFSVTSRGKAGEPHSVSGEFSDGLCQLTDESLHQYFGIPLTMLKLGYVMEKIAKVAMDTTRAAAHAVVNKLPRTMNERELIHFYGFAESLILVRPEPQGNLAG